MATLSKTRLQSLTEERPVLKQQVVEIAATQKAVAPPAGMAKILAGNFNFSVSGIMIEGSNKIGVDVQYAWEDSPRRHHAHPMALNAYLIDKYPVTNAEFKKFVDAAHYRPADEHNFLKD